MVYKVIPTVAAVIGRQDVRRPFQKHVTTSRTLEFFQEVVIKVVVLGRLCSIFKDFKPPIAVKCVNPQVYEQKKSKAIIKKTKESNLQFVVSL